MDGGDKVVRRISSRLSRRRPFSLKRGTRRVKGRWLKLGRWFMTRVK